MIFGDFDLMADNQPEMYGDLTDTSTSWKDLEIVYLMKFLNLYRYLESSEPCTCNMSLYRLLPSVACTAETLSHLIPQSNFCVILLHTDTVHRTQDGATSCQEAESAKGGQSEEQDACRGANNS